MNETPTTPTVTLTRSEDARRAKRRMIDVDCALTSRCANETAPQRLREMSLCGAWIDTFAPLHPGSELELSFTPASGLHEVIVKAKVRRVVTGRRRRDRGSIGMGVEFTNVSRSSAAWLADALSRACDIPARLSWRIMTSPLGV